MDNPLRAKKPRRRLRFRLECPCRVRGRGWRMTPAGSRRHPHRSYLRSGLYTLRKAVAVLGSRALPSSRTALGRELRAWRDSLVADLGGADAVSTQQLALVE